MATNHEKWPEIMKNGGLKNNYHTHFQQLSNFTPGNSGNVYDYGDALRKAAVKFHVVNLPVRALFCNIILNYSL
ncbi:MAG: hypothetical protein LBJ47_08710 [Tannerella sp.]|jgi:hypothetical protein|nr:hypothetical protein [Tannerella sp.]